MNDDVLHVALVGNPNSGKTTVFNQLTGLNQKTGNYPGITVTKKTGHFKIASQEIEITDLPGTNSLYSNSLDEHVVTKQLLEAKIDKVVFLLDSISIKRSLLLLSQILDLNIPTVLAINMADKKRLRYDLVKLENELKIPVIEVSGKTGFGIDLLKKEISSKTNKKGVAFLDQKELFRQPENSEQKISFDNYHDWHSYLLNNTLKDFEKNNPINEALWIDELKKKDSLTRYQKIEQLLQRSLKDKSRSKTISNKIDHVLMHPIGGYLIFFVLLYLVFQAVFAWASYPMDWIDQGFQAMTLYAHNHLPAGPLTDLLTDGILAGIGGVVIFIPQIAFLFFFLTLMEQSGYMSRIVFLTDRYMKQFGLHGKSVVPLLSGLACAIPAIMATRTIGNWKERLTTILVLPFMTCSARLPVYTILIAMVIPNEEKRFFSAQGSALFGLYLLGILAVFIGSYALKKTLKGKTASKFAVELPSYQIPAFKNVGISIYNHSLAFVMGAGKIILAISIVLWALSSYGVSKNFKNAETIVMEKNSNLEPGSAELSTAISAHKFEHSLAGNLGKLIEPAIRPLGYDWKIGVALLTSFAAREVFVGSMSTIYAIGEGDQEIMSIKNRLQTQINHNTGKKTFNRASIISLLLFYAFAMQCMSTLAIVKKETNSWKWPILQFIGMTGIAYLSALIAYQLIPKI